MDMDTTVRGIHMEEEEIALRVTINTPTETAEDYMQRLERDRLFPDTTIAKSA